jgi:hypothetical protein
LHDGVARQDPQVAGVIAGNSSNMVVGKSVQGCVRGEASMAIARYAAVLGAEPQLAIPVFIERIEPIRVDSGRIALVEDGKADPVETDKAIEGDQPEVSIGGLVDCANAVLRKTIVRCPHIQPVLRAGGGDEAESRKQPA